MQKELSVPQVAIVTGGGKGMGREIALELAASGARVLVTGRDERALGETVGEIAHAGGQARHLAGDVRDERHARAAVSRALETWGLLDVVIANAGITGMTPMGESGSLGVARAVIETNLMGAYLIFNAALSAMKGPGRLVAIGSVLGKLGAAGQAAYCASKAGLHGLVRAVAVEVAGRAITCNAVCPGWVDTEMARARIADLAAACGHDFEQGKKAALDAVPLRRFVEAGEVARLVRYLCTPAGAAITGQAISICGGTTAFGS